MALHLSPSLAAHAGNLTTVPLTPVPSQVHILTGTVDLLDSMTMQTAQAATASHTVLSYVHSE